MFTLQKETHRGTSPKPADALPAAEIWFSGPNPWGTRSIFGCFVVRFTFFFLLGNKKTSWLLAIKSYLRNSHHFLDSYLPSDQIHPPLPPKNKGTTNIQSIMMTSCFLSSFVLGKQLSQLLPSPILALGVMSWVSFSTCYVYQIWMLPMGQRQIMTWCALFFSTGDERCVGRN